MGRVIDLRARRGVAAEAARGRVRLTAPAADMLRALVGDAHRKIAIAYGAHEITLEDVQGLALFFDVEIVRAK